MSGHNTKPIRIASWCAVLCVWLLLSHTPARLSGGQENGSITILKRLGFIISEDGPILSAGLLPRGSRRDQTDRLKGRSDPTTRALWRNT
jgi:hypothetical protein